MERFYSEKYKKNEDVIFGVSKQIACRKINKVMN